MLWWGLVWGGGGACAPLGAPPRRTSGHDGRPPPPVRRCVACRSQRASTRQHNKSLVSSGTTGAFRLRSDQRPVAPDPRGHRVKGTPSLSAQARRVLWPRPWTPCHTHGGVLSAVTQAMRINQTTKRHTGPHPLRPSGGGGGVGMTPWCIVLVCSGRRLLADRHSLPFPRTLSLRRQRCPSASHRPVSFLFLLVLSFPLYFLFLSLGLSLHRPWCLSASHHSFPVNSLGRLCQRSPRTCPVSLLCVESTQRKATAFAVGQVRPSGHPKPAVRYLSPTAAGGPWDVHLRGLFPDGDT